MDQSKLIKVLQSIPVADLSREDWVRCGMALKAEGVPLEVWDEWSRNDERYHKDECARLWKGFQGRGVTGATITAIAKEYGYTFDKPAYDDRVFGWDDYIQYDGADGYQEYNEVPKATPKQQLITYLNTLFKPDEHVAYTMESYQDEDGKYKPSGMGSYAQTAGELIAKLQKYDDLDSAIGTIRPEAGAWIRFNPFDGKGIKNDNVTAYRYALVESDDMPIDDQVDMFKRLNLPIAVMVHSGGKSVHAIVRIDAADLKEYKDRVAILYHYLEENGVTVDRQNSNPSRLSRMPGIPRGDRQQYIITTNCGAPSWRAWIDSVNGISDGLPDFLTLDDSIIANPPPMADELIEGVVRVGRKMLIAGESKAGKSFLLMELAVALASGREWLGRKCKKCKVLYINMEIEGNSFINRFSKIYNALGISSIAAGDMPDVWNLRGKSMPLDELVPELLRRMNGRGYEVVILDPLYKVMMGDENNASDMAKFCNQFDRIAEAGNVTMIYCHHFSKGAQGGKKSIDRASGSGVFGRDPDAIMTITALDVPDNLRNQFFGSNTTAWRLEYTLREFASPKPQNIYFDYPLHTIDTEGALDGCGIEGSPEAGLSKSSKRMTDAQRLTLLNEGYFKAKNEKGRDLVTVYEIAAQIGRSDNQGVVKKWVKMFPESYDFDGRWVRQIVKTWDDFSD